MNEKSYCYILQNTYEPHKNRTYCGYTINPKRRIRQHNGEIKGGAKYTSAFGNKSWKIYALITGFPNRQNAMQCEWKIKKIKNTGRKYQRSPIGRIRGLNDVLKLNYWTRNSSINNENMNITVWIEKDFAHLLTALPSNVNIIITDKINLNKV